MITIVQAANSGQSFTGTSGSGLITFLDVTLQSKDYIPIVDNIAFTTTVLDAWLVVFQHPAGASSGRIIALNDVPTELSPGGFGGFAKMGCGITVPTASTSDGLRPLPWHLIFTTGALTANAQFIVSYSFAPRPSGRG
jgi:hypothetical protein